MLSLNAEDFGSYEDYAAALNNIQSGANQTLDYLRQ